MRKNLFYPPVIHSHLIYASSFIKYQVVQFDKHSLSLEPQSQTLTLKAKRTKHKSEEDGNAEAGLKVCLSNSRSTIGTIFL